MNDQNYHNKSAIYTYEFLINECSVPDDAVELVFCHDRRQSALKLLKWEEVLEIEKCRLRVAGQSDCI